MRHFLLLAGVLFTVVLSAQGPKRAKKAPRTDVNSLLTTVRLVPYLEENQVKGYVLQGIEKGSAWEYWGLRNGDVLVSYDGKPFKDSGDILKMLQDLSTRKSRPKFGLLGTRAQSTK
jgi:type II secretory pathway component PulC